MATAFRTQADFRKWLEKNYAREKELVIRLFKVHAKHRGMGYREALDEALCFGWIDGVVHALDKDSFTQRYSPRRARSKWSVVNIKRYKQLVKEGRVHPAGKAAYKARNADADLYAFERKTPMQLDPALERQFRANKRAWKFFENQPPGYRKLMIFRVMSAKREETRVRRFAGLLEQSAKEKRMDLLG